MVQKRLKLSILISFLMAGAISTVVAFNQPTQKVGADDSPITTTLKKQQDELANHEARITNTEGNVQAVADKTGTNTTTVVQVPGAAAPVDAPVITPVTVTSYQQLPLDKIGNVDCILSYSDGTNYEWRWKTVIDADNYNVVNTCDSSVIGTQKN